MGATAATAVLSDIAPAKTKGSRRKLIVIGAPVLLVVVLAGLWFSGILPGLLGMKHEPKRAEPKAEGNEAAATPHGPVLVELPEMISNLDVSGRRAAFVKLKARFELAKPEDQAAFTVAQPRVVNLLATYLHETRPEELQERAGVDRLRAALISRANIAIAPARVLDLQFSEMLVQ